MSSGESPSSYHRWDPLEGDGRPILTPPACPSVADDSGVAVCVTKPVGL